MRLYALCYFFNNYSKILIDMMDQKERERRALEIDSFNWKTDCECDWQDVSKEDIS